MLEDLTLTKLGIIGVILIISARTIFALWNHGEKKATEAMKERDTLREERERIRQTYEAEKAAIAKAHDQELTQLRLDAQQQIAQTRIDAQQQIREAQLHATARMEKLLVEVTTCLGSLQPVLSKFLERVQTRGK